MIERLVEFCVRKRLIAIVVACLVAGYGTYAWTQLKLEAYPEIGELSAQVTTQADGLAAEEIEQQITTPLERELSNTPNLLHMRSSSTFGLSLITMLFRDGTDDYWIRDRLRQKIAAVSLPSGIAPDLSAVIGPTGEIYRYTLESDSKNLMELSDIQQWIVMPALKSVPGVADIGNFGGLTRLYQLTLDPVELQRYNLGLNDVVTAINNNSTNAGGGRLARGEQSYVVRGIGLIARLEGLGNIVVTQRNNVPILVRDLGKLEYGHQEREGILGKDTNPDTIEGIVELLKTENAAQVLKGVHAEVAELNGQLAPQDVKIVPYIDRNDLVNATVSKVAHTILEGVGLVLIVLILFLGSPRSALVVAVTIPLALVVTFILMSLTRLPANLLSLGSIDFGVIVDGAIVVVESLLRRREADPDPGARRDGCRADPAAGHEPDLLRNADHHHRLRPVADARARRGQAVRADRLHGGVCAVRGVAMRPSAGPRPGIHRVAKASTRLPQSGRRSPGSRLPPPSRLQPDTSSRCLCGDCAGLRLAVQPGSDDRSRISAGPR